MLFLLVLKFHGRIKNLISVFEFAEVVRFINLFSELVFLLLLLLLFFAIPCE